MTAVLAVLYVSVITLVGAFLFTEVDWLEPNRLQMRDPRCRRSGNCKAVIVLRASPRAKKLMRGHERSDKLA
jgi:hypothetical protein